jgi:putative phosphoribosyl transferase
MVRHPLPAGRHSDVQRQITVEGVTLDADLVVPRDPLGVVVFAHGSGSSRHSPRNRQVAEGLHNGGFATLLMDLLTADEERVDERTRELRFDIPLLSGRLTGAVDWITEQDGTRGLPIALFGASTGAAAALITAADRGDRIGAVISRGGRPDLADDALPRVVAPTLLIVGGNDETVLDLNRQAARRLTAASEVAVVPGATHLFEEPGALDAVVALAVDWLARWIGRPAQPGGGGSVSNEPKGPYRRIHR